MLDGLSVLCDLAERFGTCQLRNRIVEVLDHVHADDDLVLAIGIHDLDDLVELLDALGIGNAVILELEPQSCHAVRDVDDIAAAADPVDDLGSKAVIYAHFIPFPGRACPSLSCASTLLLATKARARTPCSPHRDRRGSALRLRPKARSCSASMPAKAPGRSGRSRRRPQASRRSPAAP